MSVTPVIIYGTHEDGTVDEAPTERHEKDWFNLNLNAALHFERVNAIGKGPFVRPVEVIRSTSVIPHDDGTLGNPLIWNFILAELRVQGFDVNKEFVSVTIMGTQAGGMAQPFPFKGWYQDDPGPGGVAYVGWRHVVSVGRLPRQVGPWTESERRVWALNQWIVCHEWGHVGGAPHWGDDPHNDQVDHHTMSVYPSKYHYAGVGADIMFTFWLPRECKAISNHPAWDFVGTHEFYRLYPYERTKALEDPARAYQVLGHGLFAQEFR